MVGCKGGVEVVPFAVGPGGPDEMSLGEPVGPGTMLCRLGGAVEMTNGEGAVAFAVDVRLPRVVFETIWRRRGACAYKWMSELVRMHMGSQLAHSEPGLFRQHFFDSIGKARSLKQRPVSNTYGKCRPGNES